VTKETQDRNVCKLYVLTTIRMRGCVFCNCMVISSVSGPFDFFHAVFLSMILFWLAAQRGVVGKKLRLQRKETELNERLNVCQLIEEL